MPQSLLRSDFRFLDKYDPSVFCRILYLNGSHNTTTVWIHVDPHTGVFPEILTEDSLGLVPISSHDAVFKQRVSHKSSKGWHGEFSRGSREGK